MPTETIEVTHLLPARPERVYNAWLDGAEHGRFTGGEATVDPAVGGAFTAWDGYISGKNLTLEPHRRIVQSWRSTDFPDGAADSKLEVLLAEEGAGTRITLRHSNIPEGQGHSYEEGWTEHYFTPMDRYFSSAGSRLEGAGEAIVDAAEHAREALEKAGKQAGDALEKAGKEAGKQAEKALKAVKKTANRAAKQVKALAKQAQKRLARKPAKKAAKKAVKKPAKKAAKKKAPAKRAKSRR